MGQKPRKGYRQVRADPDWVIEDSRLVWTKRGRPSVEISNLVYSPDYLPNSQKELIAELSSSKRKTLFSILRSPQNISLSASDRFNCIAECRMLNVNKYFSAGDIILSSNYWSDAEKLHFLRQKISTIQGFKHGGDVQRMLNKIQWHDSDFKTRMNGLYELLLQTTNVPDLFEPDRVISNSLKGDVTIYRGFNVPITSSVRDRDVRSWLRQETGRGIYFTLSPKIALSFACLQKSTFARNVSDGCRLNSNERDILGGKIAVAKYTISIDKIILYEHAIALGESECICKPSDAFLKTYKFYGFDDFNDSLSSYKELHDQFDDLRRNIEWMHELAFAKIPKRGGGRHA